MEKIAALETSRSLNNTYERVHILIKLKAEGLQLYQKCTHSHVLFNDFEHRC